MSVIADEKLELGTGVVTTVMPRVNLLPPEFWARRELRKVQLVAGACVMLAGGAVAAGFGVLVMLNMAAADRADQAEATVASLNQQIGQYSEVPQFLAQVEAAQTAHDQTLRDEILWYRLLNDITLTYPKTVWLQNLSFASGVTAAQGPLSSQGVGSIAVTGSGYEHRDVAEWIETLDSTAGFTDATFSNSLRTAVNDTPYVTFQSTATMTTEALSGRYSRKAN